MAIEVCHDHWACSRGNSSSGIIQLVAAGCCGSIESVTWGRPVAASTNHCRITNGMEGMFEGNFIDLRARSSLADLVGINVCWNSARRCLIYN